MSARAACSWAGLALALLLCPAPARAASGCETGVLLPFDYLALGREEARAVEEAARRAVVLAPGACLAAREATLARLRALPAGDCPDAACRTTRLEALGARFAVRGLVLRVGGARQVALALWGPDGREQRRTVTLPSAEAAAQEALAQGFAALWAPYVPRTRPAWQRVTGPVLLGAGVAALAGGVALGLAARDTEASLERDFGGCAGEVDQARLACVQRVLDRGQRQALGANLLYGAGGALAVGGTVLLVWDFP